MNKHIKTFENFSNQDNKDEDSLTNSISKLLDSKKEELTQSFIDYLNNFIDDSEFDSESYFESGFDDGVLEVVGEVFDWDTEIEPLIVDTNGLIILNTLIEKYLEAAATKLGIDLENIDIDQNTDL